MRPFEFLVVLEWEDDEGSVAIEGIAEAEWEALFVVLWQGS